MKVALAARSTDKLAALAAETGAQAFACDAAQAGATSSNCSPPSRRRSARRTWSSTMRASAPAAPFVDLDPGRRREGDRGLGLRRLSGGAAGGAAHAAEGAGRDPVHRRVGEREGLCAVGAVRDGQVRAARARAIARARALAARHPRRAFRHRRRHPQRAPAGRTPTSRTRCSIRTRSRRATCTCCSSRAAPGRRRSSCVRGWRISSARRAGAAIKPCRRSAWPSPA